MGMTPGTDGRDDVGFDAVVPVRRKGAAITGFEYAGGSEQQHPHGRHSLIILSDLRVTLCGFTVLAQLPPTNQLL
jgi:hypothetical protein